MAKLLQISRMELKQTIQQQGGTLGKPFRIPVTDMKTTRCLAVPATLKLRQAYYGKFSFLGNPYNLPFSEDIDLKNLENVNSFLLSMEEGHYFVRVCPAVCLSFHPSIHPGLYLCSH